MNKIKTQKKKKTSMNKLMNYSNKIAMKIRKQKIKIVD